MSGRLADFSAQEVDLILMGLPITDGKAEDEFVSIDPPRQFETVQSADGLVVFCRTNIRVYPVMVTLLSSSSHNAVLSALHAADTVVGSNGTGLGAFLLKDNMGSTLVAAEYCRIVKAPKYSFGNLVKPVTWELIVVADPATVILGGNAID